jgi:phospholipase C
MGMGSLNHDFPYPAENAAIAENGRPIEQFFIDAKAGNLSSFTFVDTNGTFNSGENPQNVVHMEAYIEQIVRALGESPDWNSTILLINWDEHGGYYDHVPPPVAIVPDDIPPVPPLGDPVFDSYHRYGFRVPAIIVSPFAKKNHVSHQVYDHTSALALIERVWNLPALTRRDANALDLLENIDLDAMLLGKPTFSNISALDLPHAGDTPEGVACDFTSDLVNIPATAIGGAFPTDCALPFYANQEIF